MQETDAAFLLYYVKFHQITTGMERTHNLNCVNRANRPLRLLARYLSDNMKLICNLHRIMLTDIKFTVTFT
ncbi:MAG TPA: hypothetical protein DC061_03590 [Gemmobacter sp.]|nr:MAG: hypothetical protein A2X69_14780 [Rhodobacteraceae bacterium GWF1_65_7]HBD89757.1 hypothetical protein [Gemmobacter sp.]